MHGFPGIRTAACAALALAALAGPALAGPRPPAVGEAVRVTVLTRPAGEDTLTGTLLAFRPDALTLAVGSDSTRQDVLRASVARLEVRRRHGHGGTGALVGALAGGGIAALSVVLVEHDNESASPGGAFVGGALIGAMLGAFIGAAVESERWEEAPAP